jgi:hypothetical protein
MNKRDLAAIVGCSPRTISRWVSAGKLPAPPFKKAHIDTAKQLLTEGCIRRNSTLIPETPLSADSKTEPVTAKLLTNDAEWLRSLPGGVSKHIRQAVENYRKEISI